MNNGSSAGMAAGTGISGMLVGILIGATIGGIVALLFAPQTGTETRKMVGNRVGQFKEVFNASKRDISETAEKTADQVKRAPKICGNLCNRTFAVLKENRDF